MNSRQTAPRADLYHQRTRDAKPGTELKWQDALRDAMLADS